MNVKDKCLIYNVIFLVQIYKKLYFFLLHQINSQYQIFQNTYLL